MLIFFEKMINQLKPWLLALLKGGAFFILLLAGVLLFEGKAFPWLSSQGWAGSLGIFPRLGERVTVIERRETVSITPDESAERMVGQVGAVVVGVLELETAPTPPSSPGASWSGGVWVTNDGLLMTYRATEPVKGQFRYSVYFGDGEKKEATLAGYDRLTNLLYLRVEGINTPAAAFANSDEVKPGRRIVLLSRKSDGSLSVAPDVVGSIDRSFNLNPQTVASSEKWEGVLGLNLPHSFLPVGSPALFPSGEVGGIFGKAVIDRNEHAFLLPASAMRESLDRFIGGTARPTVGIYYLTLTPALQESLTVSATRGALVYSPSGRTGLSLIAGSPAARTDLRFGDIIQKVNGVEVTLDLPLSVALGRLVPGETATLTVLRDGMTREILLSL